MGIFSSMPLRPHCPTTLVCPTAEGLPSLQGLAAQLQGQRLGAEQVAGALLGQRCWVKWPYLQEAVVEAVSDAGGHWAGAGGQAGGRKSAGTGQTGGTTALVWLKKACILYHAPLRRCPLVPCASGAAPQAPRCRAAAAPSGTAAPRRASGSRSGSACSRSTCTSRWGFPAGSVGANKCVR